MQNLQWQSKCEFGTISVIWTSTIRPVTMSVKVLTSNLILSRIMIDVAKLCSIHQENPPELRFNPELIPEVLRFRLWDHPVLMTTKPTRYLFIFRGRFFYVSEGWQMGKKLPKVDFVRGIYFLLLFGHYSATFRSYLVIFELF